jgi:hypothetical protein
MVCEIGSGLARVRRGHETSARADRGQLFRYCSNGSAGVLFRRQVRWTQWARWLAPSLDPYAVRASPRIEAIRYDMVEGRAVTAGHDLHGNKAVALEKALRKLCRVGAQQSGRRLLGRVVIDAMLKQRATNATSMPVRCYHAPAQRGDTSLGMIKRNSATGHDDPIVRHHPQGSDLSIKKARKLCLVGCGEIGRHVAPEYFQAYFTILGGVRSYLHYCLLPPDGDCLRRSFHPGGGPIAPVNRFHWEPACDRLVSKPKARIIINAAAIISETGHERLVAEMDSRTVERPAAFGDWLWMVFVVEFADFLNRLTPRRFGVC